MKKPDISVIVPVYNVERYLKQCLESIINQTYSNIEIICVNDGTKDKSREILEEYRKRDSRIKIIDKKNGGLSSARNAGLEVAQGEYISFIDSDDWIEETMIEKLYRNITSLGTDIAICAVHQYDEKKKEIDDSNKYYTLEYFDKSFDNRSFTYEETKPFIMDVCVMAWNKLYRRSLIDQEEARFPNGLIFEDGPFFFTLFFKARGVSIVREYLYYYRVNREGSIVQRGGKQFLDIIDIVELMFDKVKQLDDAKDIQEIFCRKKVEDFIFRFENLEPKYQRAFAKKLKRKSSLVNEKYYTPNILKGGFLYNYYLFQGLKTGSIYKYWQRKYSMKLRYKIMEILYQEENAYCLKCKNKKIKIKKNPNILDIYYCNDKIYVVILKKIKFNINFNFSELEKFNNND